MAEEKQETRKYRLKKGVLEYVRAGLVLEAGATVELTPHEAARHGDVLEETPSSKRSKKTEDGEA